MEEGNELSFTVNIKYAYPRNAVFSLDEAPAGATIDAIDNAIGLFTWTPADGPGSVVVTVRVTDDGDPGIIDTASFTITVSNVAPTLEISGDDFVAAGQTYTLNLSVTDPGDDTIENWQINWGDDSPVQTVPGNPPFVEHVFPGPLPYAGDSEPDKDVDGTDAVRFADNYGKTGEGLFGDFDEDGDVDDDDLAVFAGNFGVIDWDTYTVSATATDDDGTYSSNTLEVVDPFVGEEMSGQSGEVNPSISSIQLVTPQAVSSNQVESVGDTFSAARAEQRGTSSRAGEYSLLLRAAAIRLSSWHEIKPSSSYSSWKSEWSWGRRFRVFPSRSWSLSEWRQDDGQEDDRGQTTEDSLFRTIELQSLRASEPQSHGGRRSEIRGQVLLGTRN